MLLVWRWIFYAWNLHVNVCIWCQIWCKQELSSLFTPHPGWSSQSQSWAWLRLIPTFVYSSHQSCKCMQRVFNHLSATAALQPFHVHFWAMHCTFFRTKMSKQPVPSSNAWWPPAPSRSIGRPMLSYAKICATVRSSSVSRRPFSSTNLGTTSGASAKILSTSWVNDI